MMITEERDVPPECSTIAMLAYRREWGLLEKLMRCDVFDIPSDSLSIFIQNSIPEDLIAHFICRFQAPFHIVALIDEVYPQSLTCFDDMGRYPLHIACAWGNSPETIKFLVNSYPDAAMIQDADGKCAIHHLCHTFKRHFQGASSDIMMYIVEILYAAAPASFIVDDDDGKNALEYAIDSELDLKIIKAMQRACRDVWRGMKEKSRDKPHDALQMDLLRIQRDLSRQHISSDAHVSKKFRSERAPITEVRLTSQVAKMA